MKKTENYLGPLKLKASTLETAAAYVNILRLLINEEFANGKPGDYRERVIKRALKAKLNFHSETNTIGNLVEKLNLTCKCPNSGKTIKFKYTGGSGTEAHLRAEGKDCHVEFSIPAESIYVRFKKD